jgi:hypothetical protein
MSSRAWLAALAAAAFITGCGKPPPPPIVPAEGIVRLDGKPLNRVEVRFIPLIEHGPQYVATGVTDEKGRFKLTCNGQPGACLGENRVLIVESEIPARLKGEDAQLELARYFQSLGSRPIPVRYANLADSPFSVTVTADKGEYTFDLTR